jgi:hypothetical protein
MGMERDRLKLQSIVEDFTIISWEKMGTELRLCEGNLKQGQCRNTS